MEIGKTFFSEAWQRRLPGYVLKISLRHLKTSSRLLPVKANPANISMLFQRCFLVDMTSRSRTTSNQRWNKVVHVNVTVYKNKQRRTNIVYFKVDLKNFRQHWNNVVIFKVEFHKVWQRLFHNHLHFISHFKRNMLRNTCKAAKILKAPWKMLHYKNLI